MSWRRSSWAVREYFCCGCSRCQTLHWETGRLPERPAGRQHDGVTGSGAAPDGCGEFVFSCDHDSKAGMLGACVSQSKRCNIWELSDWHLKRTLCGVGVVLAEFGDGLCGKVKLRARGGVRESQVVEVGIGSLDLLIANEHHLHRLPRVPGKTERGSTFGACFLLTPETKCVLAGGAAVDNTKMGLFTKEETQEHERFVDQQ